MRCQACQKKVHSDDAYCPHCGVVFERHRMHHSPIDLRAHFFTPRYLRFLFFSLKGRLNRERYITAHFFLMFCFLVYFVGCLSIAIAWGKQHHSAYQGMTAFWILLLIGFLICHAFTVPLKIKRSHDANLPKYVYWLWIIPGVSLGMAILLVFHPGTRGANQHGFCPRGQTREHQKEPLH